MTECTEPPTYHGKGCVSHALRQGRLPTADSPAEAMGAPGAIEQGARLDQPSQVRVRAPASPRDAVDRTQPTEATALVRTRCWGRRLPRDFSPSWVYPLSVEGEGHECTACFVSMIAPPSALLAGSSPSSATRRHSPEVPLTADTAVHIGTLCARFPLDALLCTHPASFSGRKPQPRYFSRARFTSTKEEAGVPQPTSRRRFLLLKVTLQSQRPAPDTRPHRLWSGPGAAGPVGEDTPLTLTPTYSLPVTWARTHHSHLPDPCLSHG